MFQLAHPLYGYSVSFLPSGLCSSHKLLFTMGESDQFDSRALATTSSSSTDTTPVRSLSRSSKPRKVDDPYALVDADDDSEQTRLLGAATAATGKADKDSSWAGFEDFAGLPWWKTPSVWS